MNGIISCVLLLLLRPLLQLCKYNKCVWVYHIHMPHFLILHSQLRPQLHSVAVQYC